MSPIRVLVIPVDGHVRFEQIETDFYSFNRLLGGDVESIGFRVGAGCFGIVHGHFFHSPNPRAHEFLVKHFHHYVGRQIHGPVVIFGSAEDENEDENEGVDLPTDLEQAAEHYFGEQQPVVTTAIPALRMSDDTAINNAYNIVTAEEFSPENVLAALKRMARSIRENAMLVQCESDARIAEHEAIWGPDSPCVIRQKVAAEIREYGCPSSDFS